MSAAFHQSGFYARVVRWKLFLSKYDILLCQNTSKYYEIGSLCAGTQNLHAHPCNLSMINNNCFFSVFLQLFQKLQIN